jgi:hypothetical protein
MQSRSKLNPELFFREKIKIKIATLDGYIGPHVRFFFFPNLTEADGSKHHLPHLPCPFLSLVSNQAVAGEG